MEICKNDVENLILRLRDHAEWAESNIWEVPITLPDDLLEAAETLEKLSGIDSEKIDTKEK